MKKKLKSSLVICLLLSGTLCGTGCSTTSRDLAYDNTVQVVRRPVSGTAQLGWRIKTFWREEVISFWRRYASFPLLSMRRIPEFSPSDDVMERDQLARWLKKKTGAPFKGSVQLLLNGNHFFPHFTQSLLSATNRIDLKPIFLITMMWPDRSPTYSKSGVTRWSFAFSTMRSAPGGLGRWMPNLCRTVAPAGWKT